MSIGRWKKYCSHKFACLFVCLLAGMLLFVACAPNTQNTEHQEPSFSDYPVPAADNRLVESVSLYYPQILNDTMSVEFRDITLGSEDVPEQVVASELIAGPNDTTSLYNCFPKGLSVISSQR